ncbi:hypothetical protein D3C72_792570 [compost metagenome]
MRVVEGDLGGLGHGVAGSGDQLLVAGEQRVGRERHDVIDVDLGQEALDHLGELGAEEDHLRFGVLEDVLDLAGHQSEVDRHEDRAQLADGEEQFEDVARVVGEDRDAIALLDAEAVTERVGHGVGAAVEVAVAQAAAGGLVDHGGLLGGVHRPAAQPITMVHRVILQNAVQASEQG